MNDEINRNSKTVKAKRWANKTSKLIGIAVVFNVILAVLFSDMNKIIGTAVSAIWIPIGWSIGYALGYLLGE